MVLDEVISGFRVARGGAQELYGIKADICTMAKAVANGYPIACIGGREDLMRHYGRGVAHGGTYTAQAMSLDVLAEQVGDHHGQVGDVAERAADGLAVGANQRRLRR